MTTESNRNSFLFVYGTLRNRSNHPMSKLLKYHSVNKGDAFFRGRLYDVGSYPAAISSESENEKVYGELFELKDPNLIFDRLDKYEGYDPQRSKRSLFIREKVTVYKLNGGSTKSAWIYLYNRPVDGLTYIPGGNYLEYLQSKNY